MQKGYALVLAVAVGTSSTHAVDNYADAFLQGKIDATEPTYRQWYLEEMRPAFRMFFGPALSECVGKAQDSELRGFGLVFTVTPAGTVKEVFWKARNSFTSCIEARLRIASFPASPKAEFYFGLEGRSNG